MSIVEFKGKVESIKPGEIPKILIANIISNDNTYNIIMDVHEEVKTIDEGDNVEVIISKNLPEYKKGIDFVAKATAFLIKPIGKNAVKILLSIGGLQVQLIAPKDKIPLDKDELPVDVFIKISKI